MSPTSSESWTQDWPTSLKLQMEIWQHLYITFRLCFCQQCFPISLLKICLTTSIYGKSCFSLSQIESKAWSEGKGLKKPSEAPLYLYIPVPAIGRTEEKCLSSWKFPWYLDFVLRTLRVLRQCPMQMWHNLSLTITMDSMLAWQKLEWTEI